LTSLGVEKLQLNECLDKMSSEITNLRNTIVTKDKQKETLQRALQDGAALEKSMLDEIEHQNHRAEELEAEIERLQVCASLVTDLN
jgi:chromosome segregation ATPase